MTAPLRFAVIGDPIAHSKSPAMHAAAYRALGMPHAYEAIRVTDADLSAMVKRLRDGELAGLNVTIPHKKRVLDLVDEVCPSAKAVDAANTLVRDADGRIHAFNTDVPALSAELVKLATSERTMEQWAESRAIVLGSGGAARAAAEALRTLLGVAEVTMRARHPRAGMDRLTPSARDRDALTIVQCTSAGMHGADPGDAITDAIAWDDLPSNAIALDVVYNPPETPFLARARSRGLRFANGLGMLVEQGALAFELWLGVSPPRDVMLAAIR